MPSPADRALPPAPVEPGAEQAPAEAGQAVPPAALPPEIGGPAGPEPTRYGDWEKAGRCSDF